MTSNIAYVEMHKIQYGLSPPEKNTRTETISRFYFGALRQFSLYLSFFLYSLYIFSVLLETETFSRKRKKFLGYMYKIFPLLPKKGEKEKKYKGEENKLKQTRRQMTSKKKKRDAKKELEKPI